MKKLLLLLIAVCLTATAHADINWNFDSDTDGWIARKMTWDGGGEGYYSGFTQNPEEGSIITDNGYLGGSDYVSITNLDLSAYIGGSLSLRINDQSATTHPNMPEPLEYIFLSGTVNNQNVILGIEASYTQDWETISISLDKSILKNLSLELIQDMPGIIDFNITELSALTDDEFATFMSDVDINVRSNAYKTAGPVGGDNEWVYLTQIESITVSEIPEPSAYALAIGIIAFGWILIRRKRER